MSDDSSHDLLKKVQVARTDISDEGRPQAVSKRRERGLATARERIAQLVDPESFREIG